MDFKLKFKWPVYILLFLAAGVMFLGGAIAEHGFDKGVIVDMYYACIGFGMGALAMIGLLGMITNVNRSVARVDVDSFTEAAIDEEIEKRWHKLKEEINKPSPKLKAS